MMKDFIGLTIPDDLGTGAALMVTALLAGFAKATEISTEDEQYEVVKVAVVNSDRWGGFCLQAGVGGRWRRWRWAAAAAGCWLRRAGAARLAVAGSLAAVAGTWGAAAVGRRAGGSRGCWQQAALDEGCAQWRSWALGAVPLPTPQHHHTH
jgi:hypothetical protein